MGCRYSVYLLSWYKSANTDSEDGAKGEARNKLHSTTAEALRVGRNMGAYRTLLTHFSQRYAKVPVMREVCGNQGAIVAFDLMCLDLSQLAKAPACCERIARLSARENWGDEVEEDACCES